MPMLKSFTKMLTLKFCVSTKTSRNMHMKRQERDLMSLAKGFRAFRISLSSSRASNGSSEPIPFLVALKTKTIYSSRSGQGFFSPEPQIPSKQAGWCVCVFYVCSCYLNFSFITMLQSPK